MSILEQLQPYLPFLTPAVGLATLGFIINFTNTLSKAGKARADIQDARINQLLEQVALTESGLKDKNWNWQQRTRSNVFS
jgi:hypothetical protein